MRTHRWTLVILAFSFILFLYPRVGRGLPSLDLQCGPDVNHDGVVNLFDLVAVAARYGSTSHGGLPPEAAEDTNGDGVVCISDLVCVSSNYGRNATPIPTRTPTPTQTAMPTVTPTATPTATPTPDPDC